MKKAGFTLIELSIVLVIIGLIVGGVLVGRDLVASAEMRSTVSDLQKYSAAVHAFRLKYNCIPGDCAKAVAFGLGNSGGPGDNGDGDDNVYSWTHMLQSPFASTCSEAANFWYHLAQSKLISGTYAGYTGETTLGAPSSYFPRTAVGQETLITGLTIIGELSESGLAPDFSLGNSWTVSKIVTQSADPNSNALVPSLTAVQAYYIDTKLDDGKPDTGNARPLRPYSGPRVVSDISGCLLYDPGAGAYAYDLKGVFYSPADPNRINCMIAVGKAW